MQLFRCGVVGNIYGSHPCAPGSIPGSGNLFPLYMKGKLISLLSSSNFGSSSHETLASGQNIKLIPDWTYFHCPGATLPLNYRPKNRITSPNLNYRTGPDFANLRLPFRNCPRITVFLHCLQNFGFNVGFNVACG